MAPGELERYLHAHIPLSRAMGVAVVEIADDRAVLTAPLGPNINHRETVFGGSASALAILSAWALLYARLRDAGIDRRLVIQRGTMDYRRPIAGAFSARATLAAGADWDRFRRLLERRGRARIAVAAFLEHDGEVAGYFEGEFVALPPPDASSGRSSIPARPA